VLSLNTLQAQSKKFGEVTIEDFSNYPAKYDSTESAVVIFDEGYSYFTNPSWNCIFERHVRIKVLNDEGLSEADILLIFNRDAEQKIDRIKAASYVLKDGEIKKTELDDEEIFEEELGGGIRIKKFSIPAISKGAILEYSYKKDVGNPFLFADWQFHRDIPVMFSRYKMKIPNNIHYQTVVKGVDTTLVKEIDEYTDQTGRGTNIILSKSDLPAVKDIPYINSVDDFKTEIFNQLVYLDFPGNPSRRFNNSWDKVAKELRGHPAIGKQRLNGAMKDAVDEIISGIDDPTERAKAIYSYVADDISWNGLHYLISEQGIRDTFKNKAGNSADINLMLHEMLKHAGIKADFAFISTKSNGSIITNYPIISQFNHIIVIIEIDEKKYLLDATEGYRALSMPPEKDLFRFVFKVTDDSYSWLKSVAGVQTSRNVLAYKKYNEDGVVDFNVSGNVSGYFAERIRADKEVEAIDFLDSGFQLQVDSTDLSNLENVEEDIAFSIYGSHVDENIKEKKEVIYLKPFSFLDVQTNPFKTTEREFPVYFPFRFKQRIVVNIEVPEAYEITEIPSPSSFVIGQNQARIRFLTQKDQTKLTMMIDFLVNDIQFGSEVYEPIRELFISFEEAQEQQIVLKRIAG
jgi:hypothetical protein